MFLPVDVQQLFVLKYVFIYVYYRLGLATVSLRYFNLSLLVHVVHVVKLPLLLLPSVIFNSLNGVYFDVSLLVKTTSDKRKC